MHCTNDVHCLSGFMRAFIPMLLFLLAVTGCDHRHPISEADRRKYYGDPFIYQGAPFCCVYVGLETNEVSLFATNFWRFADQHDIRKPQKHYRQYSGGPLATCKNNHVSVFEYTWETSDLIAFRQKFNPISLEQAAAAKAATGWAIDTENFWPTNASRIKKDSQKVYAPLTGIVKMAPNDTNYSLQDFKQLSEALTAALQSAFPERTIRVISYDGDKP